MVLEKKGRSIFVIYATFTYEENTTKTETKIGA